MFWVAHLEIIGFSKPKNGKSKIPLLMWKIIWFLCTLCWVGFLYPLCPHLVPMSASTLLGRFKKKGSVKFWEHFSFSLDFLTTQTWDPYEISQFCEVSCSYFALTPNLKFPIFPHLKSVIFTSSRRYLFFLSSCLIFA